MPKMYRLLARPCIVGSTSIRVRLFLHEVASCGSTPLPTRSPSTSRLMPYRAFMTRQQSPLDRYVMNKMYYPVYTPLAYVPRGVLE